MKKSDAVQFVINALETRCSMGYSIRKILNKEGMEKLLFSPLEGFSEYKVIDVDVLNYLKSKKCDMSDINFDNVKISNLDFSGLIGVRINPQTVFEKRLLDTKFTDVEFVGSFDGVLIENCDFTGSKGAIIDVSKLLFQKLSFSNMCDVTFDGSFDEACILGTNFKGSKGAKINPNKLYFSGLSGACLSDVEFTDSIACNVNGADFSGSKNAIILADRISSFKNTILTDAIVIGTLDDKICDGVIVDGAKFFSLVNNKKRGIIRSKIKNYKK